MADKSKRNLTFFLLGGVAIVLVVIALFRFSSSRTIPGDDAPVPRQEKSDEKPLPAPVEEKRFEPKQEPKKKAEDQKNASNFEENAFAVAVEGNPLTVILPWYEEIGKISIERYDGTEATGERLKSGTKVQIPDPFKPGEKINFVVP